MKDNLNSMFSVWEIALLAGGILFLFTLTIGVLCTSWMCRLSWRWGALDRPDGFLKRHGKATATLGGVPLFAAILSGVLFLLFMGRGLEDVAAKYFGSNVSGKALLAASLIILALGICDDIHRVMPRTKFLFQIMAAMILVGSGLAVHRLDIFGVFEIPLGILAVPFTLFWLVGSCNAFNFIDGMDGLASGIGLVISLVLAGLGFLVGDFCSGLLSLVLGGGLLAILLFNRKPAVIFLGDSGSQLVGLLLGMLTIQIATIQDVFYLPCAGIILSVPIVDAFLSILRRYSASESPALGDHRHIHHCLRHRGMSVNRVALVLSLSALISGVAGILCVKGQGVWVAMSALGFVLLEVTLAIYAGCLNVRVFTERLRGSFRWSVVPANQAKTGKGMAELEVLWDRMKPLFEQMMLDRAVLTLEGVNADGRTDCETYQWVRSEELIAELFRNQWTKRFSLEGDIPRIATLRLESAKQQLKDEQRIDLLLKEIRNNMKSNSKRRVPLEKDLELVKE